jgi:hypothetical protein
MTNPIDPKQFESHGEGFGTSSAQTVADLNKALTAGYADGVGNQSNGGALRVESLDSTLKIVSFLEKNIVMYNDIPKSKAYNTVEEYNVLNSYGGKGGFFISEGGLPRTEDASYQRKAAFVKFMGTTREISHPMLLVKPAHGNVVALETKNGARWMLQRMEDSLFNGDSSVVSQSFDGLKKQLLDGFQDSSLTDGIAPSGDKNIIDLRGPLTEGVFESASEILMNNYMYPTHCYLPNSAHSDLSKSFYEKGRYSIPMNTDASVGFVVDKVRVGGGLVQLRPDVFLRIDQIAPASADNALAPSSPASVVIEAQAKTASRGFKADEAAEYAFEVTALSKSGESAAIAGDASAVVTEGQEVKITIARGAVSGNDLASGFRIYRTRKGQLSGKKFLIKEIPASGSTTIILDGNEDLPGAGIAYIGQMDETVMTLRELSPMLKFPLATVASSIRWMQLYYNTPIVFRPRGFVIIKNITRLGAPVA